MVRKTSPLFFCFPRLRPAADLNTNFFVVKRFFLELCAGQRFWRIYIHDLRFYNSCGMIFAVLVMYSGGARKNWGFEVKHSHTFRGVSLSLSLCAYSCRGGTEVSVDITCCEEERRWFESGAYVAKIWKRRRVTEVGDAVPRRHGTMPTLRADVLYESGCTSRPADLSIAIPCNIPHNILLDAYGGKIVILQCIQRPERRVGY